ncbi:MAG: C69 family dipeptidase [Bifidobacterium sp.]|jgi:dipeptidase|nr:C69 family dipeptidase [Bifidobacterium sp.]MCH4174795.1 C69 family dipeptidase [Bifidobacterium sp.]
MPCTTILVGKNVSYDGSTIIARNEDSSDGEFTAKRFVVVRPEDQPRKYTSVISHLSIDLDLEYAKQKPLRYTAMPDAVQKQGVWAEAGVNAENVAMSATETITSNERVLGADPLVEYVAARGREGEADYQAETAGGIGEEDMVTLVLPYIHSARDGVLKLGALLQRYGTYEMNGIAFSDVDEIWWLETVGGHHWIAKRVPDEAYVTMPNQLGIDEFDIEDAFGEQESHLCSEDLREFIESNHLDVAVEHESLFNPRDAFGSHSDSDHVYNTPRAWYMQRYLNPYDEVWDGPDAVHTPMSDDIPWGRQPERKITIEDIRYVLASHYQGTQYDPYGNQGDEKTRGMFRPIGINRNSQLAVMQIRPDRPESCRSLQWIAYGSNAFNTLVPFFANVEHTPEYLEGTTDRVTTENFYWANRIIAALCDHSYASTANAVESYRQKTGAEGYRIVAAADEQVARLGSSDTSTANSEVHEILEASNTALTQRLKKETDALLSAVLYTVSMDMHNSFRMSDN